MRLLADFTYGCGRLPCQPFAFVLTKPLLRFNPQATVAQLEKQLEEEKQQAGKRMVREGARVRDELAAKMSQLEAELRTAKNSSSDEAAAREKALLDRVRGACVLKS